MTAQTLMIDADDTLWENNIYFERAIASFISFLNHRHYSAEEVRQKLNAVEHECIATLGYGLHSFTAALVETFERLSVEPLTPALHGTIHGIARVIAEQPIELLKHVGPTLEALRERRHRGHYQWKINGTATNQPAILYGGQTIWGLTYYLTQRFLELSRHVHLNFD